MKRIVIKIGSSSLVKTGGKINNEFIYTLVSEIAKMIRGGLDVCVVTSGAVASGVGKLGLSEKPKSLDKKQACAAIGQMNLMQAYEQAFDVFDIKCAQILVNHDDFGNRDRTERMTDTFKRLFFYGVVPVVNENDALAVEEIKFGDNDTLSALVTIVTESDLLVLISDIDGLYTANPHSDKTAEFISRVGKIDETIEKMAGTSDSSVGTGGMITKIKAAEIVTGFGKKMLIFNKSGINSLYDVVCGKEGKGTLFEPTERNLSVKKAWIYFCANVKGRIYVDKGAEKAVKERKSLLPVGITGSEGGFSAGDVVELASEDGNVFAKGIVNYSRAETGIFNEYSKTPNSKRVVVHADNIALSF